MKGLFAAGTLFLLVVIAITLAGAFPSVWDYTFTGFCGQLCEEDFWESATLEDVRAKIDGGTNVNARRTHDENSPLHVALRQAVDPAIVELLLISGADPNAAGYRHLGNRRLPKRLSPRSPLQMATEYGEHDPAVIRLLLEYGADPNPETEAQDGSYALRSNSPLVYATLRPTTYGREIIDALLSYGADHEARAKTRSGLGATPLQLAAAHADAATLNVFGQHGVGINSQLDSEGSGEHCKYGWILRTAAQYNPHPDTVNFIVEQGVGVNCVNDEGVTPLHLAAQHNGNLEVVQALLELGADVNARTIRYAYGSPLSLHTGVTPLHAALLGDHCQEVGHCLSVGARLLSHGANADAHTSGDVTPLHLGATTGVDAEVIRLLLHQGADASVVTSRGKGKSVLHSALSGTREANPEVIALLLDNGAPIPWRTKSRGYGNANLHQAQAIHWAVFNEAPLEVLKILIDRGANLNSKNAVGNTPCKLAQRDSYVRSSYWDAAAELLCH